MRSACRRSCNSPPQPKPAPQRPLTTLPAPTGGVRPDYECDWCGEPGDARQADSSIGLTVTAWDPDLSPATRHILTRKYHAGCQPSSVTWVHRADIPSGPQNRTEVHVHWSGVWGCCPAVTASSLAGVISCGR
jgi:hypothetical protein